MLPYHLLAAPGRKRTVYPGTGRAPYQALAVLDLRPPLSRHPSIDLRILMHVPRVDDGDRRAPRGRDKALDVGDYLGGVVEENRTVFRQKLILHIYHEEAGLASPKPHRVAVNLPYLPKPCLGLIGPHDSWRLLKVFVMSKIRSGGGFRKGL